MYTYEGKEFKSESALMEYVNNKIQAQADLQKRLEADRIAFYARLRVEASEIGLYQLHRQDLRTR